MLHPSLVSLPELRLKVRVRGRHPWFFRKMIAKPARPLPAGGAVRVIDREDRFVGVGFYNPRTELALRMLARAEVEGAVPAVLALLDEALRLREQTLRLPEVTNGYRLVHAEGDGIPGLIVDRLGNALVAQVHALGIEPCLEAIGERLQQRYPRHQMLLTVDAEARKREGLAPFPPLRPEPTEVVEHGMRFGVVPGQGHKTGFFADQREHRQRVRALARGRRVLDLFCNSGGFAVAAGLGGAKEVVAADLDEAVVALAEDNLARNGVRARCEHADAFDVLREVADSAFDLIVLDPPKWASGKGEVAGAFARYRDLNRLALAKLGPGGLLVTCSCSGALGEEAFLSMLRAAAAQAERDARLLHIGGAGPDHPVALECPETRYLKVVTLQVR